MSDYILCTVSADGSTYSFYRDVVDVSIIDRNVVVFDSVLFPVDNCDGVYKAIGVKCFGDQFKYWICASVVDGKLYELNSYGLVEMSSDDVVEVSRLFGCV